MNAIKRVATKQRIFLCILMMLLHSCALMFNPVEDTSGNLDNENSNNNADDPTITVLVTEPADGSVVETQKVNITGSCDGDLSASDVTTSDSDLTVSRINCSENGILDLELTYAGYTGEQSFTIDGVTTTYEWKACNTTYYIDSRTGNNGDDGLSEANAWLNSTNFAATSFNPGDCILFRRGSEWLGAGFSNSTGSDGTPNNWIRVGAYDQGALPRLNGAKAVTGWAAAGSEWVATGVLQPLGVWHNGSPLELGAGVGALTAGQYFWTSASGGSLYVKNDPTPAGTLIESTDSPNGYCLMNGGNDYWIFEDLELYHCDDGINSNGTADNTIVRNIIARNNISNGIELYGTNATVEKNRVYNNGSTGIENNIDGAVIQDNIIKGNNQGIFLFQSGTVQRNYLNGNSVRSIEYTFASSAGGTVRYNVIDDTPYGLYSSNAGDLDIYNNTFYACETCIRISSPTSQFNIRNNVFVTTNVGGVGLDIGGGTVNYFTSNNLYYTTAGDIIDDEGVRYSNSQAQIDQFAIDNPGNASGSIFGNPSVAATAPTGQGATAYRPKTSSSPLIDAGADVSLSTDIDGNAIVGSPDIGANEFQPHTCDASSVCYYIDSMGGSDANTGTSQDQAWQTLSQVLVSGVNLEPGDKVLLKRGETYRGSSQELDTSSVGTIGTASEPVIFEPYYGSEGRPILSGSTVISPGSFAGPDGNGEYTVAVASDPNQVFVDDQRWNEGTVGSLLSTEWGWSGGTLYLGSPPSSNMLIEIPTLSNRLFVNTSNYVTVDGLQFQHGRITGFAMSGSNGLIVTNSLFTHNATAIETGGIYSDLTISDNSFSYQNSYDVYLSGTGTNTLIENNEFADPGIWGVYWPASQTNFLLDSNVFLRSGSSAFQYGTAATGTGVIQNNVFLYNDYGLYIDGVITDLDINHNTIYDSVADGIFISNNTVGSPPPDIFNNIIVNGDGAGQWALRATVTSAGFYENNNLYYSLGPRMWSTPFGANDPGDLAGFQGNGGGANSVEGDPLFLQDPPVRRLDVRLQSASPAQGMGNSTLDVSEDAIGETRDMAPDVGILEDLEN